MKKKIVGVILIILIIISNCNLVFAAGTIMDRGKDWLNTGSERKPNEDEGFSLLFKMFDRMDGNEDDDPTEGFKKLAGMLMGLGVFVVAIVGVILGIRLMFTNVAQKARAKEALMIYLIGSVVIFGAVGIWSLLINILDGDFLY